MVETAVIVVFAVDNCYGFQPGCTFETNGKCPMADIPVANLAITAKAGVGGALVLQNAVSNKYNRVINREGLNSLQALMRRPFNGTPVAITKTTTMKTIEAGGQDLPVVILMIESRTNTNTRVPTATPEDDRGEKA